MSIEYDPDNEDHLAIMQYLLEEGAAELDGIDEDGEPVYKFDMDVLEEVMPELYQVMMDDMDSVLADLYQKDLIDVTYDDDLNAQITISEAGKSALLEAGFDLPEDEIFED
jgi:hypothetical protein